GVYRRARVESQRLIAGVDLTDQLLSQKSAVRVLQADQVPLSAGNTVGIQPVTDEWRAGPSDGREAFPEIKPVIVVALAFIVLCDQLKLPGFIDVQRTSSHDVQPIGVLQAGLGVIKQRSEEHTSELQSRFDLVCRLLLEKK